jgi:site-specific DNA-methyltransferase (adenine-specific)
MDILKQLPDKCIDLVLTDPPYGIGYDKQAFANGGTKYGNAVAQKRIYKQTDWDNKTPDKEVFDEILRVSKNQIIFGGNYFANMLTNSKCWICWNKKGDGRYSNEFADGELAWTSFDKPLKIYNFLWNGMIQQNMKNKEQRFHPTQKPADLFGQILRDFSKENDLVLDCFSGSGTTAIACHRLKRRFICIEKDKDYWEASCKRLEEEQRQGVLF